MAIDLPLAKIWQMAVVRHRRQGLWLVRVEKSITDVIRHGQLGRRKRPILVDPVFWGFLFE